MEISIFDFRFSIFDFDSSGFASAVDPWPSGGATPVSRRKSGCRAPKKYILRVNELHFSLRLASGFTVLVPPRQTIHAMTDRTTSLTPAAVQQILGHIDEALRVIDRSGRRLTAQQHQIRSMLLGLRSQLAEQLRSANGDGSSKAT
jgi:hypothetical protein